MEEVLDLCNGAVAEQIFQPSLPVEYVTSISGRTDAPEVRCDLQTDRQTHTHRHTHTNPTTITLAVHARRGLIINVSNTVHVQVYYCHSVEGGAHKQ